MEDTVLTCATQDVSSVLVTVQNTFEQLQKDTGLTLNVEKTSVCLPSTPDTTGYALNGSHLGSRGDHFVREKLAPLLSAIRRLHLLHPHDAFILLKRHLLTRITYLMRTVATPATVWDEVEREVVDHVELVTKSVEPSASLVEDRLLLPIKQGGLGLISTAKGAPVACQVSREQCLAYAVFVSDL